MKRLLSLLVVIAMVISLIPSVFAAKEEVDFDELTGRLVVLEDIDMIEVALAEGSDGMIYQWTPYANVQMTLTWTAPEGTDISVVVTQGETTTEAVSGEAIAVYGEQLVEIEVSEAAALAATFQIVGEYGPVEGTEEAPFGLFQQVNNVTAAGTAFTGNTTWYQTRHNGPVTIEGTGAFNVIYNGETIAAVDGKVEIEVTSNMWAPAVFAIDTVGEYTITLVIPVGSMENPAELVIGENTVEFTEGAGEYFYTWTAEEEGKLVITMPEGNWQYTLSNMTTYQYGDTQWSDSDPVVNPAVLDVAAGDVIELKVLSYDPANPWTAPAGSITFTAAFELPEPPAPSLVITAQPESVVVEPNAEVVFTVVAEGEGLTYTWYYSNDNGASWKKSSLSTTNVFTIASCGTGYHNRQYRCEITDANGNKVTSDAATVQVKYLAKDSATAFGVPVNTDHVFSVEYSVTEGVTYQWQYKGNTSTSAWANTGLTGNKTPNLTVKALSTRNGYQYRCIITVGGEQIISKAAILYVASEAAVVTKNPEPATAVCGDYATFTIEAQGEGALYHWQWYHEGTETWVSTYIAGYHTPELKVKTNNYNGGRLYRCRIRTVNGSGWNEVYTEPAMLTVLPAAEVSQQPQNVTVKAGENAQFNIVAEGEGLTYQWQWAKFVGNWKNTSAEGFDTEGIVISNVSKEMNGRYYRVIITNQYGGTYTTEYAQLFVED